MTNSIPNKKKVVILLSDADHNAGVVTPNEAVQKDVNYTMSNSFGFGGHNSVLIFKGYQT